VHPFNHPFTLPSLCPLIHLLIQLFIHPSFTSTFNFSPICLLPTYLSIDPFSSNVSSFCLSHLLIFLSIILSCLLPFSPYFHPYLPVSVQFSSVAPSCPTLCNPMNRSTPGLPVHHQLPEFTQTHIHRVGDAIQPPQTVKNLPAMQEIQVQSLGQKDPMEETATHSIILAWRIPWTEESGGLQSMASQRVRYDE